MPLLNHQHFFSPGLRKTWIIQVAWLYSNGCYLTWCLNYFSIIFRMCILCFNPIFPKLWPLNALALMLTIHIYTTFSSILLHYCNKDLTMGSWLVWIEDKLWTLQRCGENLKFFPALVRYVGKPYLNTFLSLDILAWGNSSIHSIANKLI